MSDKLRHAAQVVLEHYLSCNPLRSADVHDARCGCMRCKMDYLSEALDAHATEASRAALSARGIELRKIESQEVSPAVSITKATHTCKHYGDNCQEHNLHCGWPDCAEVRKIGEGAA